MGACFSTLSSSTPSSRSASPLGGQPHRPHHRTSEPERAAEVGLWSRGVPWRQSAAALLDGRGVDVHGWKVDGDGGNMGVENSVHSDCKGICYVFLPCNQYDDAAEEKAKAEKNALESSSKL